MFLWKIRQGDTLIQHKTPFDFYWFHQSLRYMCNEVGDFKLSLLFPMPLLSLTFLQLLPDLLTMFQVFQSFSSHNLFSVMILTRQLSLICHLPGWRKQMKMMILLCFRKHPIRSSCMNVQMTHLAKKMMKIFTHIDDSIQILSRFC